MRLFIGVKTGIEDELCELQRQLKTAGSGHFTRTENLHLTLKFLGELSPSAVDGLCEAMSEIKSMPMTLQCNGLQVFGKSGIVSAKIAGDTQELKMLHEKLETALEKRGYEREQRQYRPHITLVRRFKPFGHFDVSALACASAAFQVKELILFESRRDAGQLVYDPLSIHTL